MGNHVFTSVEQAESFIRSRLTVPEPFEVTELPFLTDFMGFKHPRLFLDRAVNKVMRPTVPFPRSHGFGELNAMAIYLGCQLHNGLSPYVNASGDAYFMGSTAQRVPVTSNVLWGAANFLYEAMDFYGEADMTQERRLAVFRKWGQRYRRAAWKPMAGTSGIDVYETDPLRCLEWRTVDHRAEAVTGA